MDCLMPVLDGYDAVREIRREEASRSDGRHIPVCAMTAGTTNEERHKCLDAGMDDYIAKPLVRADFISMVEKWERRAPANDKSTQITINQG
jgi:CheY-like chemotaxis protein